MDKPTKRATIVEQESPAAVRHFEHGGCEFLVVSVANLAARVPDDVTPAERVLVDGLVRGLSGRELAESLDRAPRTVANQLASLYRKCNVSSREELLAHLLHSSL